ncbi:MAG: HAMP domain-containing histidine kinase, partial [Oscillospiraceae bacterium]|nr:HAMP domain-containing histidine kinase [Oscillospiraceae bacterium]
KRTHIATLILFKDITRHKKDQEIIASQAEFASLGEIAGGIAHDVNSPLRAVAGEIYNLKHYVKTGVVTVEETKQERVNKMLNTIDVSIENIAKIIDTFKNQMVDAGKKEKENFGLLRILDGVKILLGNTLRQNCCTLNIDMETDIIIYGEDNKLGRVMNNLVKNAIDAYRDNDMKGVIEVTARKEALDGVKFCIITVEDKAGGIPDEIASTLFRERKTTKSATEGTGIGLYSSYRLIVADFKGKMSFETKLGEGTRFTIEIPLI